MTRFGSKAIPIRVTARAGYKAEEFPQAFLIGSRRFGIEEILDRWYGTDHAYFKVRAEDQDLYILRYDQAEDVWELVFRGRMTPKSDDDS